MNLQSIIYYLLVLLGAIIGAYIGLTNPDSDYELNTGVAPRILTYIHETIPSFYIPTPPLPDALTRIFARKDRTMLVGYTHGFKFVYRTADLNRLTRAQRDLVRAAVGNYFDTHTEEEIDQVIEEGDALFHSRAESDSQAGNGQPSGSGSWTRGTATACLKLDDRWGADEKWGAVEGYMKLAREERFDEDLYCGPTFTMTVVKRQFVRASSAVSETGSSETGIV
ncbi:hypothetical protein BJX99DRAFT_192693 [Aspergillus californicus]